MEETFAKNLSALRQYNPALAGQLEQITELTKYEVFQQGEKATQLNIYDHERKGFMYNDPLAELAEHLHAVQPQKNYKYLYFFGIGNGFFLQSLLLNSSAARITVVEPEAELLYISLHLHDFADLIQSGRLQLFSADEIGFSSALAILSAGDALLHSEYLSFIQVQYYGCYEETYDRVRQSFSDAMHYLINLQGSSFNDAFKGISQSFENLEYLCRSMPLQKLAEGAKGETAIVISTGPSLTKQLPLLKQVAPYARLICVDASLPILARHNIKPDFVVTLERDEPTSKFFVNTPDAFQEEILFLCASLQHRSVYEAIKGKLMSVFRPLQEYKYLGLDRYGYIGGGPSAANMAHDLAYVLGCANVVFIGQDLAFAEDGSTHGKGHIFDSNALIDKEVSENRLIEVPAYGGKGTVKTHIYWLAFKKAIEHNALTYRPRMESINATEGGARIEGTVERPFGEVCADLLQRREKTPIVYMSPEKSDENACRKQMRAKLRKLLKEGKKVRAKVATLYEKIEHFDPSCDLKRTVELYNDIGNLRNGIHANEAFREFYLPLIKTSIFMDERTTCTVQASSFDADAERLKAVIRSNAVTWEKMLRHTDQLIGILEAHQSL